MQTPKTSGSTKSGSGSEGGRRISPRPVSLETTKRSSGRVVRQLKTSGLEPSSSTSQPSVKTPKSAIPKIVDRVSPRGPVTELQKNRLGRIAELETQVTQLEDALRTVKDQLIVSESWKKQAKLDAEESRQELLDMTLQLQESQKLLARSSSNQEVHESHSSDSAALAAALLEIDQLKVKLDTASESEATQTKLAKAAYTEIRILRENMSKTLSLMEEMKNQLKDCKISESQAQALANETLLQLETAKKTMESLKLSSGEYDAIVLELEQSKARVSSLEGIIEKMKTEDQERESQEIIALKSADKRFPDEHSHETLENVTAELKKTKADIEELKANLMDKETELQCVLEENDDLNTKLANLILGLQENKLETESNQKVNDLESKLTSLETELREKSIENEKLKLEISKINSVIQESKQDFNSLKSKSKILETRLFEKSNENEKLKLEIKKQDNVMEEVKRSKCEVEEELRRLKVQMGQWRKAAEAATAMLCDENNDGMVVERTWSMGHYSPRRRMNMGSPCSMDIVDDNVDDDEFLKRKNGSNMLKRIGVLWKKPQSK